MTVAKQFGRNVARARRAVGLSQVELADRAQIHRSEVSHLERGQRKPRVDTLMKVTAALEVEPSRLLQGIEWQLVERPPGYFHESRWRW